MPITRRSDEVFQATGGIVQVRAADVADIVRHGTTNARRRARLCAHPGPDDRLHEMLICLDRGTYIRPHRHGAKCESFHMVVGELDVVVFRDDGAVREVVRMGAFASGKVFYYRVMEPAYHSVLIHTPFALFHETTNGPFDRADTEFAPWAPAEGDPAVPAFVAGLRAVTATREAA
ncbi:MAG TPA: WbuC family cupin fold metalloprotein [Urbifossiella sp.]|nr:WbuC family cupin fold metalloprotein [Urbifossiella sp.]